MGLMGSEMAGPMVLKLGGMIKGMWENVFPKEFFGSINVDRSGLWATAISSRSWG